MGKEQWVEFALDTSCSYLSEKICLDISYELSALASNNIEDVRELTQWQKIAYLWYKKEEKTNRDR